MGSFYTQQKNVNLRSCWLKNQVMSKICEISGKKVMFGNNVSKAMNKTKRRFEPNIIKKRFYIPEENKWITLKVSASTLKTINKKGISSVLKIARSKGKLKA